MFLSIPAVYSVMRGETLALMMSCPSYILVEGGGQGDVGDGVRAKTQRVNRCAGNHQDLAQGRDN